jgi:hypothetical protein
MPVMAVQRHHGQLPVGDPDAPWVASPVEFGADLQARAGLGRRDQLDDHLMGDQLEQLDQHGVDVHPATLPLRTGPVAIIGQSNHAGTLGRAAGAGPAWSPRF